MWANLILIVRAPRHFNHSDIDNMVASVAPGDLLACLWDFNTVSGTDRRPTEHVLGRFGSGTSNDNTEFLLAFCQNHRLRIAGSWYRRIFTGCRFTPMMELRGWRSFTF